MKVEISDAVKYIGANAYDLDLFEGQYVVPNGMAYNSYVILDEKIAVMDTADKIVSDAWLENLKECLDGRQPDYRVAKSPIAGLWEQCCCVLVQVLVF